VRNGFFFGSSGERLSTSMFRTFDSLLVFLPPLLDPEKLALVLPLPDFSFPIFFLGPIHFFLSTEFSSESVALPASSYFFSPFFPLFPFSAFPLLLGVF